MPHKCVVPLCRGNYASGPQVATFGFPKSSDVQDKWIRAIKRENFKPSKHSRVCELHFSRDDIISCTTYFDNSTGRNISVPLKFPRLKEGAIPCKIIGGPAYLCQEKKNRQNVFEKLNERENNELGLAMRESLISLEEQKKKTNFATLEELVQILNDDFFKNFTVIRDEKCILIAFICTDSMVLKWSIKFDNALKVIVRYENTELKKLENFVFPSVLNNIVRVKDLINSLQNLSETGNENVSNMLLLIKF